MKKIIVLAIAFLVIFPVSSFAEKRHDMAGLQFKTPNGWTPSVNRYTVNIQRNDRNALLMVSRIPFKKRKTDLSEVKSMVESTGRNFLSHAVETELVLHKFDRGKLKGYYFKITDKEDKPGEYKHMIQGALIGDHLSLVFTALFHSSHDPSEEVLAMLGSIGHSKTKR